ncbi:MAG: hypothetical protein IPI67_34485 [Myxococcales bacterium]|nr:hypothetical protein [Myxococcales bacterium]
MRSITMRSMVIASATFLAVPLMASCSGSDPDDEATATASGALGQCPHSNLAWATAQNGGAIAMRPISTWVCWLTQAAGRFDGEKGYDVGINVEMRNDGWWWLTTRATQEYGEAACAPRSCFTGDGANDVVWVSTENISTWAGASGGSCDHDQSNAWWGDAATIEQAWPGMPGPGRTAGGGESVDVAQSSNPFGSSILSSNDCQEVDSNYGIRAQANSLFVGTPSGGKACHFTGVPFSVSGNVTLNLGVYTDDAICYFTHIHGKFAGGGEKVRIYPVDAGGGRFLWYARSWQGGSGSSINAKGRCYFYNQWDL